MMPNSIRLILVSIILLIACKNQTIINNTALKDEMVMVRGGQLYYVFYEDTIDTIINDFQIDKYEVSVLQFKKFIDSTNYVTDAEKNKISLILEDGKQVYKKNINWRHDEFGQVRQPNEYDRPVIHVSYNDALTYARWKGKSLPTVYQWIYAMNGGKNKNLDGDFNKYLKTLLPSEGDVRLIPVNQGYSNSLGIFNPFSNISEYSNSFNIDTLDINNYRFDPGKLNFIMGGNILNKDLSIFSKIHTTVGLSDFRTGFRCVYNIKDDNCFFK